MRAAAPAAPAGVQGRTSEFHAYEAVRRTSGSLNGFTDENLNEAGRHAAAIGDEATRRRVAIEHADRQDRRSLTPAAAEASIARRHAANSPAAPAGGDSVARHTGAPVSVDIFENGAGQIDVGPSDNRAVYDLHRQGGKWYAEGLQGPYKGQHSADTVANLARKLADAHGVSGTVSIEDERDKGKSLTQRFEHAAKAAPTNSPNAVRVGATDAERAAHAPRLEGESDLAYQLRTVPGNDTAERVLNGYSLAGLRAVARNHNISVQSGWTKARMVEAIMQALRYGPRNSRAISRQ